MGNSLDIVLKTVERCNLNCSYCYFFNGVDQSFKIRPKFIKKSTIDQLGLFIKNALNNKKLNIQQLSIVLHGGEPTMQPKEDFIYTIEKIKSNAGDVPILFSIQTNATLITESWIKLFNKYNIRVGVSIDGPPEYNDKYRLDHYGNQSSSLVEKGVKLLMKHLDSSIGCLTVINPEFDSKNIYQYLISLGFKSLDFLLPDNNYKIPPNNKINTYSSYIINLFDTWVSDDNPEISIRKLKSIMLQLIGQKPLVYGFGKDISRKIPIIAIRSDGTISPTDELMSTDPDSVTKIDANIFSSNIEEVLQAKIFQELYEANVAVPTKCANCCWYNACGGGNIVSRFSEEKRFNNHSIYCDSLQEVYAHIAAYMIKNGVPRQIIEDTLFKNKHGYNNGLYV